MDYDVSLHDLVELVVIFATSPSSSKTDSKYIPYCVFDVGGFIGSSCREVSHLSPHNILSLGDTQDFHFLLNTTFRYLSNKIGFIPFGFRMLKISQF